MGTQNRYSPEVRERAVGMFKEHVHEHPSRWAAIQSIAEKIGCTAQTLDTWVRRSEPVAVAASNEAEKLRALERALRANVRWNTCLGQFKVQVVHAHDRIAEKFYEWILGFRGCLGGRP